MVETQQKEATVTAIDPATRIITLTSPEGKQVTFKAGPAVRNFDQIHVGDTVRATTTEALAVALYPKGTQPNAGESTTVAVAPKGGQPGALMVDTTEVTAKILAIDPQSRTVVLQFPDGTKKVKVGNDVDLTGVKVGEDVTARLTQSLAIKVEKP